jgi:hypothetical protein
MGHVLIFANVSAKLRAGLETGEVERTVARLDQGIKGRQAVVKRIFIEAESVHESRAADVPEVPRGTCQRLQCTQSADLGSEPVHE